MEEKMEIKFRDDTARGYKHPSVKCPKCDGDYLHHNRVEIFNRHEDATTGLHVTVDQTQYSVDENIAENPSSRRHGLHIQFECEECGEVSKLVLYQHKGNSYMGWAN